VSLTSELQLKPADTIPTKIYLENPIVPSLNAAKNVNPAELEAFVKCCEKSYALIESLNISKKSGSLNYRISDLLKELAQEYTNVKTNLPQQQSLNLVDEMNAL